MRPVDKRNAVGHKYDLNNKKNISQLAKMLPKMTDVNLINSLQIANEKKKAASSPADWRRFFLKAEEEIDRRRHGMTAEHLVDSVYHLALAGYGNKR